MQSRELFAGVAEGLAGLLELVVEPVEVGLQVGEPVLVCVEHPLGLVTVGLGGGVVGFGRAEAFLLRGAALREGPVDLGPAGGWRGGPLRRLRRRRLGRRLGAADDAGPHRGELGRVAVLVDDAEPDVAQRAGQLPGPQQLGGAGVDESGVEGFGQPLRGLGGNTPAAGGSLARDVDEVADQVVALPGQFAPAVAVGSQVGLAQLLPQLGQRMNTVRVGPDELVGKPRGDRGLAQGNDRCRGRLVTAVPDRLRQLVAGRHELLGWQPVQLDDCRVYLHASTIHARSAAANLACNGGQVVGSQVRAQPHVAHPVTGLAGLGCGVGGYLGHDGWFDLGQWLLRVGATPPVRRDLVRPGVSVPRGGEYGGELDRLLGLERDGASDHDQLGLGVVEAGDDDLGVGDRAQHPADDDLAGLAVFDLSSGS